MEELVDSRSREQCPEIIHHIAHLRRVELHSYRILHPRVGHENPKRGNRGSYGRKPRGGKMETLAHAPPAEKHHGNERGFHKESQYPLDGERRTEDVANKP